MAATTAIAAIINYSPELLGVILSVRRSSRPSGRVGPVHLIEIFILGFADKPVRFAHALIENAVMRGSMLFALVQPVGADRLVIGSDCPVGESDPVGFIKKFPGFSETEALMITGKTAAQILGLSKMTRDSIT